jgi:hypothetical protein
MHIILEAGATAIFSGKEANVIFILKSRVSLYVASGFVKSSHDSALLRL